MATATPLPFRPERLSIARQDAGHNQTAPQSINSPPMTELRMTPKDRATRTEQAVQHISRMTGTNFIQRLFS
ncbi:hypothetical protein D3C77_738270 [compost metagenome]